MQEGVHRCTYQYVTVPGSRDIVTRMIRFRNWFIDHRVKGIQSCVVTIVLQLQKLCREFLSFLNKLTPEKYEKIIDKVKQLQIKDLSQMNEIIKLLCDKVI